MTSRRYENFDLLVEALAGGTYRSRVTASPMSVGASATFAMPFDATELENLLLKLDPGRSQMRRAAADPRPRASVELGGRLFDAVFGEEVLLAWTRSQDATREAGAGLRLRLQLTDAPEIAGLPWELLYDRRSNTFPAQSERTPVVRYLEVVQPPRPLAVEGPLRILVVLSSPTDLPELDVEAEWRRMQDLLGSRVDSGAVHLDRLPAPTTTELASWLRSHDTHVLHVIGHGDYDENQQEGVLYFCDQYGRSVPVPAGVLGPYLHDHDPLRLVFLNACQSGRLGAADPFSGMAGRLVQQDCTAVVAMQFPISDGAATAFTGEFYAALVDGMPVDQAVTSARKGLLAGYASEWATPVLYLNAPDGQVFQAVGAGTRPPVGPPQETHRIPAPSAPSSPPLRPGRGRLVGIAAAAAAALVAIVLFAITRVSDASTDAGAGVAPPASSVSVPPASVSAVASPPAGAVPSVATATVAYRPVEGPQITARRLATPPTIDGRGEDWPATAPIVAEYLVAGNTATAKGLWSLGWDPDNLYLLVRVVDPDVTTSNAQNPARLFQGDAVTVQFGSPGANADGINLSPGDASLSIGPNGSGGAVAVLTLGSGPTFDVDAGRAAPSVKAAAVDGTGGYTVEAAVPWSAIRMSDVPGPNPPAAGTQFGANLLVDDADAAPGSQTGIRSRVSNNRYVSDHTPNDGGYRRYWGLLTLGS
ncbi:MAG TPA: CHAT domain-containing protein [Lapillicoccus sp.]|nr:CHAT domain-containing protein [Lapillicoccus sp.]